MSAIRFECPYYPPIRNADTLISVAQRRIRASTLRFGVYSKTPPPFHAVPVFRAQQGRDSIPERERAFATHRRIRRIVPCELGADRGARGASIPLLQSGLFERMLRAFSFRRGSIIAAV